MRISEQAKQENRTRLLAKAAELFVARGFEDCTTRDLAVAGAHIAHMLRDTFEDARAGYFNVPCEMLEASAIGPTDVHSDAYRAWVADRVKLARSCFDGGRDYFARVEAPRGELFYFLRSSGGAGPDRVKVRTPSLCNWGSVLATAPGHKLADVPMLIAGIRMKGCYGDCGKGFGKMEMMVDRQVTVKDPASSSCQRKRKQSLKTLPDI